MLQRMSISPSYPYTPGLYSLIFFLPFFYSISPIQCGRVRINIIMTQFPFRTVLTLILRQNPQEKLEQLRLSSLSLDPSQLVLPAKNVPRRDMPRSSIDVGVHPGLMIGRTGSPAISDGGNSATSPGVGPTGVLGGQGHVRFREDVLVAEGEGTKRGDEVSPTRVGA
jgi:hypothetical protein